MAELWLPVEDEAAWVRATETAGPGSPLKRADNGQVVTLSSEAQAKLDRTGEDVMVDDLTKLRDVHDATFLEALRRRYEKDDIYTAIGPVIISINPYKSVKGCTPEMIAKLCREGWEASPPHVVRAATIAFTGLTSLDKIEQRQPQSILISGESGAGKTEACKLCLLALAELSQSTGSATDEALESAVLLETFGNAKTVYNDNSSRFGKW
jgi:myosin heavy subunit